MPCLYYRHALISGFSELDRRLRELRAAKREETTIKKSPEIFGFPDEAAVIRQTDAANDADAFAADRLENSRVFTGVCVNSERRRNKDQLSKGILFDTEHFALGPAKTATCSCKFSGEFKMFSTLQRKCLTFPGLLRENVTRFFIIKRYTF